MRLTDLADFIICLLIYLFIYLFIYLSHPALQDGGGDTDSHCETIRSACDQFDHFEYLILPYLAGGSQGDGIFLAQATISINQLINSRKLHE